MIEIMLYLAIISILFTAVINLHLILGGTSSKLSSNLDASRNRRSALSTIEYLIRNSDGLLRDVNGSCSDFSTTTPLLALYFKDDTYLPGTCVSDQGGGVKITVDNDNNRIKMTCHPNIENNGEYQACTAAVGTTYYLSSPNVAVYNNTLSFATSTATSTASAFTSIITHMSVGVLSGGQRAIQATSTATSTVVLRNAAPEGLVAWYRFDDASGNSAIDSIGGHNMTCTGAPDPSTALVNDSTGAFSFDNSTYDFCWRDFNESNFDGAFTLSAWVKIGSLLSGHRFIINKYSSTNNRGYFLSANGNDNKVYLRVYDGTSYYQFTSNAVLTTNTVYNITASYDYRNKVGKIYVYQKGTGGISTTTASTWLTLVNSDTNFSVGGPLAYLNGVIDELRVYNRALSDEEVWALQSQGEN